MMLLLLLLLHAVPVLMERWALPLSGVRSTLPVAIVAVDSLVVEGRGRGVVGGDADGGNVGGDLHLHSGTESGHFHSGAKSAGSLNRVVSATQGSD